MKADRWKNIEQIFNVAVTLPPDELTKYLPEACGDDMGLREEINSMLTEDSLHGDFLSEPVFALGAKLLDSDELLGQTEFASYKLQKLLGRGGMGAVYLAEDTRLRRLVAIKVLPPALAQDTASLSRFRREARAASQLSHPNIAHIYEFGETNGRFFLAMEYAEGRTLRHLIKEKAIHLSLALSVAKQIAHALISTHERGIIHRDIKPENIIVRDDGLVKVLDFGLAKSYEPKTETSVDDDALPSQTYTQSGMILGTIGYMSPEQIRGVELGASTDLWSLGVVLFEMLTGKRPFQGETPSDVQAAILKDEPLSLNESANAPNINQIITKALAKNIAERYQTASEFAQDIERIQLQSDSNFHDSHQYFAVTKNVESADKNSLPADNANGILRWNLVLPVGFILAIISGWLIFQFALQKPVDNNFAQLRTERLTYSGNALRAAISPDGKSLAYVFEESGNRGVFLRRRTASNAFSADAVALVAPSAERQIRGVSFDPSGAQIYFRAKTAEETAFHIFRVSIDGGEPQKIVDDAQSTPSFSPDGRRMVFLRTNQDNSRGDLIIADANGANERVFYSRQSPEFFPTQSQPAWSPDGNTILCAGGTRADNIEQMLPLSVRVSDGQMQPVLKEPWGQIWTTHWVEGGSAFIMTGRQDRSIDNNQLWRVAFPSGEILRLTNDFNDYYGISISERANGAGVDLASVILKRTTQLWKVNLAAPVENAAQQITHPGGDDGFGVSWSRGGDDKIFYGSVIAGNPDVWAMNADGSDRRQLTFDSHLDSQPSVTPDGRYVIFGSLRSGIESLWRMKSDGTQQTLLVSDALREPLAITPDGLIYYHSTKGSAAMWRVLVEGGQPEKLIAGKYFPSAVSPDGKFLAASIRPEGAKTYSLALLAVEENSSRVAAEFKPIEGAELPNWLRWTPDGKSIVYIVTKKGVGNLWAQPVDGGEPKQLTNFTSSRIYSFDFSPDGKQVICARGELSGYIVMLSN